MGAFSAFMRTVLNFVVAGALVGVLATTLLAPRYYAWDNTPAFGKALCDCADTTRQTADKLISAQMTGLAAGAGIGLIAGIVFRVLRRKKVDPAPPTAVLPPPTA